MHLARRLMALSVLALAMLAAAPAASASPVEVVDEHTGNPCDPCVVHAVGSSELIAHTVFGPVLVSECDEENEGEINHDGTGHVTVYENAHATDPNCTRIQCASAGESEWSIFNPEELSADQGTFDVRFCVEAEDGSEHHCTVAVQVDANPTVFSVSDICNVESGEVEVVGQWQAETTSHDEIDIVHL